MQDSFPSSQSLSTLELLENADALRKSLRLDEASEKAEYAYLQAELEQNPSWMAKAMNIMGIVQSQKGNHQIALDYFGKSADLYLSAEKNPDAISKAYNNVGISHMSMSNYEQALEYYFTSLKYANNSENPETLGNVLSNLGLTYHNIADYITALTYFSNALTIFEKTGNKIHQANVLNNMGMMYSRLSFYSDAIAHYQKALAIYKELEYSYGMIHTLNNLGEVYKLSGDTGLSKDSFAISLDLALEFGNSELLAAIYGNLGEACFMDGEYEIARDWYAKEYEIVFSGSNVKLKAHALHHKAKMLSLLSSPLYNYKESVALYEEVLSLYSSIKERNEIVAVHQECAELHARENNYASAYYHLQEFISVKKDINYDDAKRRAAMLTMQYEITMLVEEKDSIEKKNALLKKMNEDLDAEIHLKSSVLGMASHDLKNPLNTIKLLAESALKNHDIPTAVHEDVTHIAQTANHMLSIITGLIDSVALEMGKINIQESFVDVDLLLEELTYEYQVKAESKNITVTIECDENCTVKGDRSRLQQVFDNLISNAVKYSFANSTVAITAKKVRDTIRIEVKDSGPGLTEDDKSKLFRMFQKLSAKPTGGESSSGVGLASVKKIVELHNGNVWCESVYGEGATFIVTIPSM